MPAVDLEGRAAARRGDGWGRRRRRVFRNSRPTYFTHFRTPLPDLGTVLSHRQWHQAPFSLFEPFPAPQTRTFSTRCILCCSPQSLPTTKIQGLAGSSAGTAGKFPVPVSRRRAAPEVLSARQLRGQAVPGARLCEGLSGLRVWLADPGADAARSLAALRGARTELGILIL